jgi:phage terminase large subunit
LGGHHKDVGYNSDYGLYLSFDFNVEPITCLAAQHEPHREWIHIIKEYRLLVSDIWALTDHIVSNVPEAYFIVTGDASGSNRQSVTRGNRNYYQIIKQQLAIGPQQLKVPRSNPLIRNTRVLCNSLLQKHPNYWVNTNACPHLNIDLNTVTVLPTGKIDEGKDKRKGHLLAGFRYYNWTFHMNFIDKRFYDYVTVED